ncbi:hypothetical protein [Bradyrhizobium sp. USDA 4486]
MSEAATLLGASGLEAAWKTRRIDCSRKPKGAGSLAASITDPEVIQRLTALAEEYEPRASPAPKDRKG